MYGMESNFVRALDGLSGMTLDFNLSDFNSNDIVPAKVQHFLASVFSSKSIQDMEVKFDMTT